LNGSAFATFAVLALPATLLLPPLGGLLLGYSSGPGGFGIRATAFQNEPWLRIEVASAKALTSEGAIALRR
jgi:hypothetical protein